MGAGGGVIAKGLGASTVGRSSPAATGPSGPASARSARLAMATMVLMLNRTPISAALFCHRRSGRRSPVSGGNLGSCLPQVVEVLAGHREDPGLGPELHIRKHAVGAADQERGQLGAALLEHGHF